VNNLDGFGDTVTMGNGSDTVGISEGGNNIVTMGNGLDTVNITSSSFNTVTTGSGSDTITVGTDANFNTFTLNDTNASLVLNGIGNKVFVNGGNDLVTDTLGGSDQLLLAMEAGGGNVSIANFSTSSALVDLVPSLGFANSSQVLAALTSDGHGGTLLNLSHGSIDFLGITPGQLASSNFLVG
jgi:hypothetical protein